MVHADAGASACISHICWMRDPMYRIPWPILSGSGTPGYHLIRWEQIPIPSPGCWPGARCTKFSTHLTMSLIDHVERYIHTCLWPYIVLLHALVWVPKHLQITASFVKGMMPEDLIKWTLVQPLQMLLNKPVGSFLVGCSKPPATAITPPHQSNPNYTSERLFRMVCSFSSELFIITSWLASIDVTMHVQHKAATELV